MAQLASFLDTDVDNNTLVSFVKERGMSIGENGLFNTQLILKDWHHIWLAFSIYTLILAILFAILFKHKHDKNLPLGAK
ncbi:hypothetical protein D3C87_1415600 [compost metagenome]